MTKPKPFKYFKTPPESTRLAVMLYIRFPLSLRKRRIDGMKSSRWHLDETFVKINDEMRYLWRAAPLACQIERNRRLDVQPRCLQ